MARPQGWEVTEKTPAGDLPVNNSTWRAQFEAQVPDNAEYTRPHWSRANEWRDHIYQINKPQYLHLPFAPPEVVYLLAADNCPTPHIRYNAPISSRGERAMP